MRLLGLKGKKLLWQRLEGQYQGFITFREDLRQGCVVSAKPFGEIL